MLHFLLHATQLSIEFGFLKLHDLHRYLISLSMCKHRDCLGAIGEHFHVIRNSDNIQPVFQRLTMPQKFVAFVCPHTWKSLPVAGMRCAGSYAAFQGLIKEYLYGLYWGHITLFCRRWPSLLLFTPQGVVDEFYINFEEFG